MRLPLSLTRFVADDSGQDLIEYALLTAVIGLVGAAAWNAIAGSLGTAYGRYDTDVQDAWEMPDPNPTS